MATREFGPGDFPLLYKLGPNGEVPAEIRELVEAREAFERRVSEFEADEPFIKNLEILRELTEANGIAVDRYTKFLKDEDGHFISVIQPYDKYVELTERLTIPVPQRSNLRMRLRYSRDFQVSLGVHMPYVENWETLEMPGESPISPNGDKWRSTGDWKDVLWIYGPADSVGPNTLKLLRTLTTEALITLNKSPQPTEY